MAGNNFVDGNLDIRGTLSATTMDIPASTVTNNMVSATADIDASKLEHQFAKVYAQESGTTSADATQAVHVVYGATGTLVRFEAGSITACAGAATIDVDLLVNGSSVLSAAITLDNANTARIVEVGTISSASLSDGDVIEIDVDATAGGGTIGNGVFASLILREDAS